MSPEQAEDHELDGRSDIYSLGCVACWLLTGQEVFKGDSVMGMLMSHVRDTPISIGARGRDLPPQLVAIIDRCLLKKREDRWPDAMAFTEALEAVPIPPGQEWTPGFARAWWRSNVPENDGVPASDTDRHEQVTVQRNLDTAAIQLS
jgi:serine/threonine protein kinase